MFVKRKSISDDEQVEKWKEEKQKLLEDFMTKEGETEFLRQQLTQIQTRAENAKKEQSRIMEEQIQKFREEINGLLKEKTSLESQLQLQVLKL
jgi:predicted RNase H-like nuclease (RuvC/YqgF family)